MDYQQYYLFTKSFSYKPHKLATSWSLNAKIAAGFDCSVILITRVNDKFIMNPKSSNKFYKHRDEKETIRLTKNNNGKVFIAINTVEHESLFHNTNAKVALTTAAIKLK